MAKDYWYVFVFYLLSSLKFLRNTDKFLKYTTEKMTLDVKKKCKVLLKNFKKLLISTFYIKHFL